MHNLPAGSTPATVRIKRRQRPYPELTPDPWSMHLGTPGSSSSLERHHSLPATRATSICTVSIIFLSHCANRTCMRRPPLHHNGFCSTAGSCKCRVRSAEIGERAITVIQLCQVDTLRDGEPLCPRSGESKGPLGCRAGRCWQLPLGPGFGSTDGTHRIPPVPPAGAKPDRPQVAPGHAGKY